MLTEIVRHALIDSKPHASEPSKRIYPQYAFSQVCRQWRSVALNDSSLWTTPAMHKPDLALDMIKRCRILPITVRIDREDCECWSAESWATMAKLASGIKHMYYTGSLSVLPLMLEAFGGLHVLESLNVRWRGFSPVVSNHEIIIPLLQTEELPRLRRICLTSCFMRWDSKCLSNLTHLTIHAEHQVFKQPGLFSMLGRNPTLVYLKLHDLYPEGDLLPEVEGDLPNPGDFSNRASLPNLKHLDLCNTISHMHRILFGLYATRLSRLELWVRDRDPDAGEPGPDSNFAKFSRHLGESLNELHVSLLSADAQETDSRQGISTFGDEFILTLTCHCERIFNVAGTDNKLDLCLTLDKTYHPTGCQFEQDVATFLQKVPTGRLEVVAVQQSLEVIGSRSDAIDSLVVWKALAGIPSIKRVGLTGNDVQGIPTEILTDLEHYPAGSDSASAHIAFPRLQYLKYGTRPINQQELPSLPVDPIVSLVQSRARAGVGPALTVELHQVTRRGVTKVIVQDSGVEIL